MKIHSPSPHKQVPSKCNDYFFNYFTLGVVSYDSLEQHLISMVGAWAVHLDTPMCTYAAVTVPGNREPSPSWLRADLSCHQDC